MEASRTAQSASHRAHVMSEIARTPGVSRRQIAQTLGIVPATVGSHVRVLLEHGFVSEGAPDSRSGGRPSIPLEPAADGGMVVGVSIEPDRAVVATVTTGGQAWEVTVIDFPDSVPNIDAIATRVREHGERAPSATLALGVSVSGVVDSNRGEVVLSAVLGWEHRPLASELRRLTGLPTTIENDVITLATRELAFASAVPDDFLLVHLDIGVGMAIVTGRSVVPGVRHGSIEFGHISLDRDGAPCRCGNRGCVQTVFGLEELRQVAPDCFVEGQTLSSPAATEVQERADALGRGVGAVATLLGIDRVLVSGRTTDYWTAFSASFTQALHAATPTLGVEPSTEVIAWTDDATAVGAAALALGAYLEALR